MSNTTTGFGAWLVPWIDTTAGNERRKITADEYEAIQTGINPGLNQVVERPLYCGRKFTPQPGQVVIAALCTPSTVRGVVAAGLVASAPAYPITQGPWVDVEWMLALNASQALTGEDLDAKALGVTSTTDLPTSVDVVDAHALIDGLADRAGTAFQAYAQHLTNRIPPLLVTTG